MSKRRKNMNLYLSWMFLNLRNRKFREKKLQIIINIFIVCLRWKDFRLTFTSQNNLISNLRTHLMFRKNSGLLRYQTHLFWLHQSECFSAAPSYLEKKTWFTLTLRIFPKKSSQSCRNKSVHSCQRSDTLTKTSSISTSIWSVCIICVR